MPRKSRLHLPKLDLGKETLGQRLLRLRKERGYTQVDLAQVMGIIQGLVSDYERDKLRPHPEMIIRFAKALEVSADELLGLEKVKKSNGIAQNRRLLRRIRQIEQLPRRDQQALLRVIDNTLANAARNGLRVA